MPLMNNDNITKRLLLTFGIPGLIGASIGVISGYLSWGVASFAIIFALQFLIAWILKFQAERKNIAELDKDALEVIKMAHTFQKDVRCAICHRPNMVKLDLSQDGTLFKCPCGTENKLVISYDVIVGTKMITEDDMNDTTSKLQQKLKELSAENNVEP